ncbi:Protein kinase domain-containing protein ppk32 [Coemansia spiralis]|uniref:Protein kinase domain-containing protein ppk32 n=1 Tax=Coemansia spiralis TaxID=417178 RepID=A0A9W8L6K5_9FUNG|nr:Protein kinase domain-containing protein ppk32 [Coemansia spiralis]
MDSYISKLRDLASSAASSIQGKISRDYSFNLSHKPFGQSGLWSLYKATRSSTGQTVTVWVFDKRYFERGINRQLLAGREQAVVIELLKNEAGQLTRLRHPSVLQVIEPLEESRGSLMFVTEQVLASLDDLVNPDQGHVSGGYRVDGDVFDLDDFEIQKGLLQISKVLGFLHGDARIVHGNLVPASVLINAKGDWKLGGFGFAQALGSGGGEYRYDYQMSAQTQRRLDYMAPEAVFEGKSHCAGDLFSLGCLATAVYFNGRSPLDCRNDVGAYRRDLDRLASSQAVAKLPEPLRGPVLALLAVDPARRLSLGEFQRSSYFDDVLVAALRYLESLAEQSMEQKVAFMRGLPRVLSKFPERVLRRKILPALLDQTSDHALLPFTMPNVFLIVEKLTEESFNSLAMPGLRQVFAVADPPPQLSVVILEHLALLQRKARPDVFRADVLPVVYSALMSAVPMVQDKALEAVPAIAETMDGGELRTQVLPRVQQLYTKASVLSRKICALKCLQGMMKALGEQTIVEHVIPLLRRTKTQEHGVIMAMLEMYEEMGMAFVERGTVAREILPALWVQAMNNRLDVDQFRRFLAAIKRLEEKIEREQILYLEKMDRGSKTVEAEAWGFNDEVAESVSVDTPFESLVLGDNASSPRRSGPAMGPGVLVDTGSEVTVAPSGWEWDAPTFGTGSGASKDREEDDFGSFSSFLPPPPRVGPVNSAMPVSSRLRTATPLGSKGGKLGGVTKIGSAAPLPLPPPPPGKANFSGHQSIGSQTRAPVARLGGGALSPPSLSVQKHVGGKAANLGDFDPFA